MANRSTVWFRLMTDPQEREYIHLLVSESLTLPRDAWDVESYHLETRAEVSNGSSEIILNDPLRVSVAATTKISESSWIRTVFSLDAIVDPEIRHSVVEIDCEVEWRENRKFLKTEFPVPILSSRVRNHKVCISANFSLPLIS